MALATDSLTLPGECQLMVSVMSMSPIQTIIAFKNFHLPERSFRAAARAEPAPISFLDHRMWEQILRATIMSPIRATIVCKNSVLPAPPRLLMQVLIKQLSAPAPLHQSRLTGALQHQAPEASTRTHGLKARLPLVPAQP